MVVVDRSVRSTHVDCVTGDDTAAVEQAIAHLTDLGHHDMACLDVGARPSALRRTCEAGGLTVVTAVDELSHTAILALGDTTGTAALTALLRAGKRVPEDVSSSSTAPAGGEAAQVTTIAPPPAELGRLAMTTLLSRIKDGPSAKPQRLTVPHTWTPALPPPPPESDRASDPNGMGGPRKAPSTNVKSGQAMIRRPGVARVIGPS